ncbi:hypothetical protein QUF99_26630 [Bacillus sp. DX4.1]|uniref:hypothetical protein n=1 Tax=Bacillus sp. DX4.1 TaxID=3055867 RepID=UPI0025A2A5F1|nr:hypothetical protein [Bacillus sp. DX4.1]MDM5190775.1 hypothetical protein [Bacillus sp. DX4.1]
MIKLDRSLIAGDIIISEEVAKYAINREKAGDFNLKKSYFGMLQLYLGNDRRR